MARHSSIEDWQDKEIPVTDLIAAQDPKFVINLSQYSLDKPHPGYGTDPNIINEYGHTRYPKWVGKVIVNNAEEEAALTGEKVKAPELPKSDVWTA